MKSTYPIVAALALFAVLAVGILLYGLQKKRGASRHREASLQEAARLCAISEVAFAGKDRKGMSALLARARQIRATIEADRKADQQPAEKLSAWIDTRTNVQQAVDRCAGKLAGLRNRLTVRLPSDPNEQPSPKTAAGLESAMADAGNIQAALVVTVEGRRVDFSPVFRRDLRTLTELGKRADRELKRRRDAYAAFVKSIKLKSKESPSEQAVAELEKWIQYASADPKKREELEKLFEPLVKAVKKPNRGQAIVTRLDGVIASLAKKQCRLPEARKALEQYDALMRQAEGVRIPRDLRERGQRVSDKARQRVVKEDAATKDAVEREKREARKQALIEGLIAKSGQFDAAKKDEEEQKKRIRQAAESDLKELGELDKAYAEFFRIALLGGVLERPKAGPRKKLVKYVGPRWQDLAKTEEDLRALLVECPKVKRTVTLKSKYDAELRRIERYLNQLDRYRKLTREAAAEAQARESGAETRPQGG